ncbi:MAG: helix-turn-helix transcriptional regulator, partial [Proteobacteria bacterium]|nr:helix-turn-helix transcriptional regulator [Pseudomonadota bacterium]
IRAPYLGFALVPTARELRLVVDTGRYPLGLLAAAVVDVVLEVARAYVTAVCGTRSVRLTYYLARPRPARAPRHRRGARLVWGAPFDGLGVPCALRDFPCPMRDAATSRAALARCREALEQVLHPGDFVARTRHWLVARLERGAGGVHPRRLPALAEAAAALAVSPRTLVRRLAERGTGFRALRAAEQHALARRLLGDARYTVGEIGLRLGYGDAANFARAFKRTAGVAPGHFRRGARGGRRPPRAG